MEEKWHSVEIVIELMKATRQEPISRPQIERLTGIGPKSIRLACSAMEAHGFLVRSEGVTGKTRKPTAFFALAKEWGGNG